MAGQAIVRQGDLLGAAVMTFNISTNVFINGKLASMLASVYSTGGDGIAASQGSSTVSINGRKVHRVGDQTEAGPSTNGSPNVFAGGAASSVLP